MLQNPVGCLLSDLPFVNDCGRTRVCEVIRRKVAIVRQQKHDDEFVLLHLRSRNGPVLLEMVAGALGAEFEDATIVLTGRALESDMAGLLFSNSVSGNDEDDRVSSSMVSGISSLIAPAVNAPSEISSISIPSCFERDDHVGVVGPKGYGKGGIINDATISRSITSDDTVNRTYETSLCGDSGSSCTGMLDSWKRELALTEAGLTLGLTPALVRWREAARRPDNRVVCDDRDAASGAQSCGGDERHHRISAVTIQAELKGPTLPAESLAPRHPPPPEERASSKMSQSWRPRDDHALDQSSWASDLTGLRAFVQDSGTDDAGGVASCARMASATTFFGGILSAPSFKFDECAGEGASTVASVASAARASTVASEGSAARAVNLLLL